MAFGHALSQIGAWWHPAGKGLPVAAPDTIPRSKDIVLMPARAWGGVISLSLVRR